MGSLRGRAEGLTSRPAAEMVATSGIPFGSRLLSLTVQSVEFDMDWFFNGVSSAISYGRRMLRN
jgi:hypothetical protein